MPAIEAVLQDELSVRDRDAYDAFVAAAKGGHYSQSRAWAEVEAAGKPFRPAYFLARRRGEVVGAGVVLRSRVVAPLPFAKLARGPVCDDPADMPAVIDALLRHTRASGIFRLSVMPYWDGEAGDRVRQILESRRFRDVQTFSGSHVRTLRLDLTAIDDKAPFGKPDMAKVRREARRAERAGASARQAIYDDLAAFRTLNEAILHREGRATPSQAWYDALGRYFLSDTRRGALFVTEFEGQIVAAVFIACHRDIATYVMGASSDRPPGLPKMMLPMAKAILWAKEAGAATFDLGGIPMAGDSDPKRASIAEFKYSYARNVIGLVHEHVRWF